MKHHNTQFSIDIDFHTDRMLGLFFGGVEEKYVSSTDGVIYAI